MSFRNNETVIWTEKSASSTDFTCLPSLVIVRCVTYYSLVVTLRLSHVFDVFVVKCWVSVTKPFASGNEIAHASKQLS